ncbi:MAG: PKD-like domain-containing protein [Alistipes sp.]
MKNRLYCICAMALLLCACNENNTIEIETPQAPVITLDSQTAVYTVKIGRTLLICPTYENVDQAVYTWTIEGKVVGEDPTYAFCEEQLGEVFLSLEVKTRSGKASEQMRVDVVERELPTISLAGATEGFTILTSTTLPLTPEVAANTLPCTYLWTVNGAEVSTEKAYTFVPTQKGEYTLAFATHNEDGEDLLTFKVKVCTPEEIPFNWVFEQTEYNMSAGRTLRLLPLDITNAFQATYTWAVDGQTVQESQEPAYLFTSTKEGAHRVTVTMKNNYFTINKQLTVHVCPAEGTYYRVSSAGSQAHWSKVYDFLAAPGQFVNENYTATTMTEACAYAEGQMTKKTYISLGGFGGYIVVGFDHSIKNTGDYDFAVVGNSFEGSSEPGIVWVMQDENGDGIPNDTWYELKGSESGAAETIQDYAVTYYRPRGAGLEVMWTDNQGGSGSVDYLATFHRQDTYYPAWVGSESYTLRGTCLKARNYDQSGNGSYWVNAAYGWGYADNFSATDRLSDNPNAGAAANANHFKISNAVRFDGTPIQLKYIDFVKVQTGVNAKSGWLGEISTEIFDFYDYTIKNREE